MSRSAAPSRNKGIELSQDLGFQERDWAVQHVGWLLIALVIIAALAGVWGSGPLSDGVATSADGAIRIEYARFARMNAPTQMRIHFTARRVEDGEVRLWLDRSYLAEFLPKTIVPSPRTVEVGTDRLTYVFDAERMQAGGVVFQMEPQTVGRVAGRAGIGEADVGFRHFVYP